MLDAKGSSVGSPWDSPVEESKLSCNVPVNCQNACLSTECVSTLLYITQLTRRLNGTTIMIMSNAKILTYNNPATEAGLSTQASNCRKIEDSAQSKIHLSRTFSKFQSILINLGNLAGQVGWVCARALPRRRRWNKKNTLSFVQTDPAQHVTGQRKTNKE